MSMTEAQEQICVIRWSQQPDIRRKWPELAMLFHVKNETREGACAVMHDKAMGVKRGVPDLFLPAPHGKYHGCWIEMKTDTGRASNDQKWWGEHLQAQGYFWAVCHGWRAAVDALQWYLSLEEAPHGSI